MSDRRLALFIFRRDLRLHDNSGLIRALQEFETVAPLFILDPRQAGPENPYRGLRSLGFLRDSLLDLTGQLRTAGGGLSFFEGRAEEVVARLLKEGLRDRRGQLHLPAAVYLNRDYTPFSRKRDEAIRKVCEGAGARFVVAADLLLNEPEATVKDDGSPYTVFTPFFRRVRQIAVAAPRALPRGHREQWFQAPAAVAPGPEKIRQRIAKIAGGIPDGAPAGGRKAALAILKKIGGLRAYEKERDFPQLAGTSGLSPHNKFGTLSPREFYHAVRKTLGPEHALLRELYWRDFFTAIAFFFPHVFGACFRKEYDRLRWKRGDKLFDAWRAGLTGFPIVDAGMRELAATGCMHNRVRMITASFLVKDLHIDWRRGEKHFAQLLVDYDPAVNNGNWQWAASTGCDAQPYFRVFNPYLQQKKFDADAVYIRRWVPELRAVDPRLLHRSLADSLLRPNDYPEPIVDHAAASQQAKEMFRSLKK